ncbi:MAG TPA: ROK family protein [Chloroflexia bacterium]|nr:ROK family protein [Chloroflexia bacterium]
MKSHKAPKGLFVGVDVGGTKVAVLVVDAGYQVCGYTNVATLLDGPQKTLAGIAGAIRRGVELAGASMSDVSAVGLGVPGRVDPKTGLVRQAVNLGWEELQAGEMLSAQLGVPCLLENDVRLAALGVQRHLGTASSQNMAYVSIGTGIAAGLVLNGRIYRGAHGMAGEIGHMIVDPNGPLCLCGAHGCLEALAAGPAIARLGEEAAKAEGDTLLRNYLPMTAKAVYEAATAGDAAARAIVRQVSRYLALALQHLIVTYDVERIVLGGGVARDRDAFLQPILTELERLWQDSMLAGETLQPDMIGLLPLDYDAGTWGAVVLASGSLARVHPPLPEIREGGEELQSIYVI